jgi:hypothetical protein
MLQEDMLMHENPFLARDKWKRFFMTGFQKIEVDSTRSVKNATIHGYKEYVFDNFDKFTDEERLRILDASQDKFTTAFLAIKENVLESVRAKMTRNEIDFRNGHVILILANSLSNLFDLYALRGKHDDKFICDLSAKGLLN